MREGFSPGDGYCSAYQLIKDLAEQYLPEKQPKRESLPRKPTPKTLSSRILGRTEALGPYRNSEFRETPDQQIARLETRVTQQDARIRRLRVIIYLAVGGYVVALMSFWLIGS